MRVSLCKSDMIYCMKTLVVYVRLLWNKLNGFKLFSIFGTLGTFEALEQTREIN